MKRHPLALPLALLVASIIVIALVGCSGRSSESGNGTAPSTAPSTNGGATITEQNFAFSPSTLSVKVGDTVTFTNADSAGHNVKIDGQELGVQNQGESKTWKATKAGSFPFSCVIHPAMTGQITVQ